MSFYNQLIEQTREGREYLLSAPIIEQVFNGEFDLSTYTAFLNQAYHHVKHTVPLLMAAGSRLDHQHAWVQKTLHGYINEEFGHEAWILDDLEACGCDREGYAKAEPPHTSEILVAYLYDYVARRNPLGIFGMVLVLEGTSADLAPAVAKIVQAKLNLPDAAMTYLTTHGELDQGHIGFFEGAMNKVTSEADHAAIVHVANTVYRLYGDIYRALPAAAKSIDARQAA